VSLPCFQSQTDDDYGNYLGKVQDPWKNMTTYVGKTKKLKTNDVIRVKRFTLNRSRFYCFAHITYRSILERLSKNCRRSFCTEITYSRFPLVGHF